jgi:methylase of polypeptide subunit release factors
VEAALERFLDYLRGHGVEFDVSEELRRCQDHDGPLSVGAGGRHEFELPGYEPVIEYRDPEAVLAADHASQGVALALLRNRCVRPGDRFFDVGCGTGVLAVIGARMGAGELVLTDVVPEALQLARRTLEAAKVEAEFHLGSLLSGIPADRRADVIAANLPHKPVPDGFDLPPSQDGGREGDRVHGEFVPQALRHLAPGGRVYFFMHSLPHPRLLKLYQEHFDLRLLAWRRRFLQSGEYGELQESFVERARDGVSYLGESGGRRFLVAGVWEAALR